METQWFGQKYLLNVMKWMFFPLNVFKASNSHHFCTEIIVFSESQYFLGHLYFTLCEMSMIFRLHLTVLTLKWRLGQLVVHVTISFTYQFSCMCVCAYVCICVCVCVSMNSHFSLQYLCIQFVVYTRSCWWNKNRQP